MHMQLIEKKNKLIYIKIKDSVISLIMIKIWLCSNVSIYFVCFVLQFEAH